jgi:hypothetical protein
LGTSSETPQIGGKLVDQFLLAVNEHELTADAQNIQMTDRQGKTVDQRTILSYLSTTSYIDRMFSLPL